MRKIEKCLKCQHTCKLETETNAILKSCSLYLSKRATSPQKEKSRGNIGPASDPSLNQKEVCEND
jgi:hypothetical protein